MIYSLKGQGKRRFLDPCDLVEAIQVLKGLKSGSNFQMNHRFILGNLARMLEIIRKDLGIGNECVLERAVVMSNTRKKGGR